MPPPTVCQMDRILGFALPLALVAALSLWILVAACSGENFLGSAPCHLG